MTVSKYIFNFLKDKTDCVFMIAGGQAMYLNNALLKSGIRYICAHHEQAATMAAEAYARLTGKLGVILVTAGPGSTNTLTGVVGAWTDSASIMIISGQWFSRNIKYQKKNKIRQYGLQGILTEPIFKSVTKYFKTVDKPKFIKKYLKKAYFEAFDGRPGPVWLDIPLDIQNEEV